jgi:excisionase family DNA binding protein
MDKAIFTSTAELADLIKTSVAKAFSEHDSKPKEVEKLFLSIDEACKFLNLAKQTVYGFTSKNEIPFIKRGKKLYFKKEDIENWLLGNKNGAL